jgi:hypothetical protein
MGGGHDDGVGPAFHCQGEDCIGMYR